MTLCLQPDFARISQMKRKLRGDSRRAQLAASFFLGLFGAGCLLRLAEGAVGGQVQSGGIITGRIIASESLPDRISVQLVAEGEMIVEERYTDSNGNFSFGSLPNGTYAVSVQVKGYRPVRRVVVVDLQIMARYQTEILLEHAADESKAAGQIISGSPRSYLLNAKNRTAFNLKAVREFEKANKLQQEQNFQGAMTHYQKALNISPDFYPALNNLGALYLRDKDAARAETAFLKSLELNPEDGEAYINLGHVLYEEGKYSQAIVRLEEGLRHSPHSAVGHFFIGSAYMKLGQFEKAERSLKMALTLDPKGLTPARLQLGNLYLKRNDLRAASAELEAYLEANPSDPQAPAIKKTLANIKVH